MSRIRGSRGYLASLIMALLNSIVALITFFIINSITNDKLVAIVGSSIALIISMGFSIKLAKRVMR